MICSGKAAALSCVSKAAPHGAQPSQVQQPPVPSQERGRTREVRASAQVKGPDQGPCQKG